MNNYIGQCCVCGQRAVMRGFMMLALRAPTPGTGWGCLQCGLPADGAIAALCRPCTRLATKNEAQPVQFVCGAYPGEEARAPIEQCQTEFRHNMQLHPEADQDDPG